MVEPAVGNTRPVRPEARAPRTHSKPNPLPARLMVGIGALAAVSVIAAGIGRLPGVSVESASSSAGLDPGVTMLAAAVPLFVYFISGRWFVRGIAAGAVKG